MPRYHLNLYNDEVTIDSEGILLPDLDAAKRHAIDGGRDLIATHVRDGRPIFTGHHIDITTTAGAVLHTVHFGDLVTIKS